MENKRSSGILMHISSLPGRYGCGAFGKEALDFVDTMEKGGFTCWQVLPFSVPDEFGSPYKAISAFAGNPWFIDLDTLVKKGLLTSYEVGNAVQGQPYTAEFDRLFAERLSLLRIAASRVDDGTRIRVEDFISSNSHLDGFCTYYATKLANGGAPWYDFDPGIKPSDEDIFVQRFIQYEFFNEWMAVKSYANSKGISIIGDLPIYVDADSSDVYYEPRNFLLDKNGKPEKVAGVPPDYFSPDGQLWGNPLYNWSYMKKDGYSWWLDRIEWQLTLFDGVRIDHFRAFSDYFAVDARETTAKNGKWCRGPGLPFVNLLKKKAGNRLIIAEDLGDIDDRVRKLLNDSGLPGMRVFQFAFIGKDSPHLPHNYPENCVAYSGTHDNNTLLGFLWELDDGTRSYMLDYCNHQGDWTGGSLSVIKALLSSHASKVIFPVQDLLGYGSDTRMNRPGVAAGNWQFRVTKEQLDGIDMNLWKHLNEMYAR